MPKLTLNNLGTTLNEGAASTINTNSDRIEEALENTLSRDGTSPNSMNADLDMNSNDLLNVNQLDVNTILLNGQRIVSTEVEVIEPDIMLESIYDPTNVADDAFDTANHSYIAEVTGAVSRPAIAKFRDGPISLEDCGYVSGNALTALNSALASGLPVQLGPKEYTIDGEPAIVENTPVFLKGYGFGLSVLTFISDTRGIRIEQDNYLNPTHIENFEIRTTQEEPGTALYVSYSPADSINNRNFVRCKIVDLTIMPDSLLENGWEKGIVLEDVHRAAIIRPNITGRRSSPVNIPASFKNMSAGIEIIGQDTPTFSSIPSDIYIDHPAIETASIGISSLGEVEGLIVNKPALVGVGTGVFADYTTKRPWIQVKGGHINCFDFAVSAKNAPQTTIEDVLIYKLELANADTFCVFLDECDDSSVKNLELQNQCNDAATDGEFNGVVIRSSNRCSVDDIRHKNPSKTVILDGTTDDTRVSNLFPAGAYANATVQTFDDTSSGTNTYVAFGS